MIFTICVPIVALLLVFAPFVFSGVYTDLSTTSCNFSEAFVASGSGAFFGALASILLGLLFSYLKKRGKEFSELVHAQYCLISQYNSLLNTWEQYLNNFANSPADRHYLLRKSIGVPEPNYIDTRELQFLVTKETQDFLFKLSLQQNGVKLFFVVLEERNKNMSKLERILNKITEGRREIHRAEFDQAFKKDRPLEVSLLSLTESLYINILSSLNETYDFTEQIYEFAKSRFPMKSFIRLQTDHKEKVSFENNEFIQAYMRP